MLHLFKARSSIFFAALLLPALFFTPNHAWGSRFYLETAGGVNQFYKGSPLFGDIPSQTSYALATTITFAGSFTQQKDPMQFHLGIQDKIAFAATDTQSWQTHSLYVLLRLQLLQTHLLSIGGTNQVYHSTGTNYSLWPLNKAIGGYAVVAEYNYIYPITPEVAAYAGIGVQGFYNNGTWGPLPLIDAFCGLRFYFGKVQRFNKTRGYYGEDLDPKDYDGYRYPYGRFR